MYGLLSIMEIDDGGDQYELVATFEDRAEAAAAAAAWQPDFDPAVGCSRLAYGQASERYGMLVELYAIDPEPGYEPGDDEWLLADPDQPWRLWVGVLVGDGA